MAFFIGDMFFSKGPNKYAATAVDCWKGEVKGMLAACAHVFFYNYFPSNAG